MKNLNKRFFYKTFVVILVCVCFITGVSFAYNNITNAYADTETEEKSYCTATLDDEFTDNEIIVVINHSTSISEKKYTIKDFSEINCYNVKDLTENLFESGNANEEKFNRILKLNINNSGKENVLEAIKILEKRKDILSAEPNYIKSFDYESQDESYCTNNSQRAIVDKPLVGIVKKPNDPYYAKGSQWAIDKIELPKAWNITTGSSTVLVGIIDTGIDANNIELKNRVNKSLSKCFGGTSNPLVALNSHGTNVAGVIGAESNNGEGITGVCWDVSLVSLRSVSSSQTMRTEYEIEAITYAGNNGIKILNDCAGSYQYDNDMVIMKEAIENYSGLFVCAAGNEINDNDENPLYPSSFRLDNLISVGATDSNDNLSYLFDNYGTNYGKATVDIFAPGEDILTTDLVRWDSYAREDGTSMAAPFVTGVAALLLSENPNLTASQIKTAILNNVDKVDALSDKCVSGGRLNAYKAVKSVHAHTYSGTYTFVNQQYHQTSCTKCYETTNSGHWAYSSSTGRYKKCEACGGTIDTDKYPILLIGYPNSFSLMSTETSTISTTYQLESYLNLQNAETVLSSEEMGEVIEYYDEKFFAEYSIMFGDIDINDVAYWLLKNALNWQAE